MKYKAKKVMALLLSACMVTGMLPAENYKAETTNIYEYEDDFSTDTSDKYVLSGGSFEISDGTLNLTNEGVVGLSDYMWYNGVYEFTVDMSDKSEWAGIQFDKQKPTDGRDAAGYMLYVRASGSVELYTGKNGVIGKGNVNLGSDKKVSLKVMTEEGKITVYVVGEENPLFTVEDSSYDYGYFTFVGYGSGTAKFDDLKITAQPSDGRIRRISIAVENDKVAIGVGETMKVNATVLPIDADAGSFSWKVTDVYGNETTLASISQDGYLTAGSSEGVVKITAASNDDASINASLDLPIVNEPQMEYEKEESNENYTNDFSVKDANYVAYRAGSEIADGKLRLLADGITMTNLDNYKFGDAIYEFDLNIAEVPEWAGIMFNKTVETDIWDNSGYMFIVQPNGSYQFHQCNGGAHQIAGGTIEGFENVENHYKIEKIGSSIKIYFNDSAEPFIDVVDDNFATGFVSLVASSYWGQTKVATFDNLSVKSLEIPELSVSLDELYIVPEFGVTEAGTNDTIQMKVYSAPYIDLTGKLLWTVTDENGNATDASIDENGVLSTGATEKTLVVKAMTADGTESTATVEVKNKVTATDINVTAAKRQSIMGIGKSVKMNAYVYPYTAEDNEVIWTVTNTDGTATELATISKDGILTSKAKGTVRVTATLASDKEISRDWIMTIGEISTNGQANMQSMKYAFFSHYVPELTVNANGQVISDPNELANAFNAEAFADEMAAMGVEYIVFTAFHYRMVCLWDSEVMKEWDMSGHYTDRDMIGDMIDAVQEKGINVVLYVHPFDGYDFKTAEEGIKTGWGSSLKPNMTPYYDKDFDYDKWNNFVNDVFGEVMDRYGDRIMGIWCDEGNMWEGMNKAVDFERLIDTITSYNEDLITFQNYYGFDYGFNIKMREYWKHDEFADYTGASLRTFTSRVPATIIGSDWWSSGVDTGKSTVPYAGKSLFVYQILQSGSNLSGGGIQWSAGPLPGENGGYQTGVEETMQVFSAYLNPISWTVKNTFASTSYITGDGVTIKTVDWGVATKSTDDSKEYIHVLNKDSRSIDGKTLTLPVPKDYKVFESARLAMDNSEVILTQDENGVKLTLTGNSTWNDVNTVIELTVDEEATKENQEAHKDEMNQPDNDNSNDSATETPNTGDSMKGSSGVILLISMLAVVFVVNIKYRKKYNKACNKEA